MKTQTQTQTQTSQESPITLKYDANTNVDHLSAVSCGLNDANKGLSSFVSNDTNDESCQNSVRERAYFIWENAGYPIGDGSDFWLLAEEQIKEEQIKENAGCPIGDGFDFWLLAQEQIKEEQIKEEQIKEEQIKEEQIKEEQMDQYIGRS
jgi:hypothetical protein